MAAKVFRLVNGVDANGFQALSESNQTAADTAAGWVVGTGATNHSELFANTERASSTFTSTTPPDGSIDTTNKDCFRSPSALTGSFVSGNWTFQFAVRSPTQGGAADGRIRFRLFRADADGSNAVEITAGQQQASIVTNVTNSADFNSSLTLNPGAFSITAQYLFLQIAWERTGAGGMTTTNIRFRTGSSTTVGTVITTANFIETLALSCQEVITVAELANAAPTPLVVRANDAVTTTDARTTHLITLLKRAVSDSVTVTPGFRLNYVIDRPILVQEAVTVALQQVAGGVINRSVNDPVGVIDVLVKAVLHLGTRPSEAITVADVVKIALQLGYRLHEDITVADIVKVALQLGTRRSEAITVQDVARVALQLGIRLNETVTVTDVIQIALQLGIVRTETVTVTELAKAVLQLGTRRSESVIVADVVSAVLQLGVRPAETIAVADVLKIALQLGVVVTDSAAVADVVKVALQLGLRLSDSIVVADVTRVILTPALLSVADALLVAETVAAAIRFWWRPTFDIAAGGWTPSSGTDLYPMVDEVVSPNDADYIVSGVNPVNDTAKLGLQAIVTPAAGPITFRVRYRKH